MKIEMLDVGWFEAPAGVFRAGEEMDRAMRFPVPAYVIETATERILVDTGLNPAAIAEPGDYYSRPDLFAVFALEQQQSVAEQIDVSTLTRVVLTHLHWDHVGGLGLIPESVPVVIQRAEWQAGHDDAAIKRNLLLAQDYSGREVTLVDGDHDLLGDGSVQLLLTPGHTPGHQSVRVGGLVLGGDVTHFASGLDDRRFPMFADDHERQGRSADRLLAMREAGLTVRPGHDPDVLVPGAVAL
ncbi:MAG: N-acyl homoserine lactonase family protein [Solirubrobacteraceae bacterium]